MVASDDEEEVPTVSFERVDDRLRLVGIEATDCASAKKPMAIRSNR